VEWNGRDHFVNILELTRFLQITEFPELYDTILSPIEAHFNSYSIVEQVSSHKVPVMDSYWFGTIMYRYGYGQCVGAGVGSGSGRIRNYLRDPDPQFEFRIRIRKGSGIRFLLTK